MPDATLMYRSHRVRGRHQNHSVSTPTGVVGARSTALRLVLVGDAENLVVRRHAEWFGRRGFDVHIVHCPMQDRVFEPAGPVPGVREHYGLARPGHRRRQTDIAADALRLRRVLMDLHADGIHLMSPRRAAQLAVRCTPGPAKFFSPWGADVLDDAPRSAWSGWRARRLLGGFDSMIAASSALAGHARAFADTEHECIVPWGVDGGIFRPDRDVAGLRSRLGLREGQRIITSPRQLGHKYNHDQVLRAFADIRDAYPDHVLVFKYAIVQGDLDRDLARLARELGIEHAVRFLGPSASPEESHAVMADLLAAADLAISVPTWDGGTPATLFECLASATPLVLSDIDTNRESLTAGREARFCRPGDPNDLAREFQAALDPEWRLRAARAGRELVRDHFDRDRHLDRLARHYRDLMETPHQ